MPEAFRTEARVYRQQALPRRGCAHTGGSRGFRARKRAVYIHGYSQNNQKGKALHRREGLLIKTPRFLNEPIKYEQMLKAVAPEARDFAVDKILTLQYNEKAA